MAARNPGTTLSAGHRLGRYEVLAKLASGGMAVVYVGRAQGVAGFERLVALKVLHSNYAYEEEFIRMFLDEARLAARIRHPNVVPTIDVSNSPEDGLFLVMEYIEGDHLGALLSGAHRAGHRLPTSVALRVVSDVLAGLGAAHDLRDETGKPLHIVHRDVSPHNVMVGRDGISRLTDFGVAKAEDRLSHTRDGQVKGKLAYMAPEQASSGTSDARSDLFSVSIILWECLTGRRLFRADSTAATLHKLLYEEIPLPSTVDPLLAPLDAVMARALHRDPARRYQTADEFADALEEAAPAVGGLASLRAVSKAVRQYAAPRLKRDKSLIEEAKRALREQRGTGGFDLDGVSEPSLPSASALSLSALSMSKISGVYSNATSTGVAPRVSIPPPVSVSAPRPIPVPPPAGMPALDQVDDRALRASTDLLSARVGLRLTIVLLLLGAALAAWLFATPSPSTTRKAEVAPVAASPGPAAQPAMSNDLVEAVTGTPMPQEVAPTPQPKKIEKIEKSEPAAPAAKKPTPEPPPRVRTTRATKVRQSPVTAVAPPTPTRAAVPTSDPPDRRTSDPPRTERLPPDPDDVPLANPYTK